MATAQEYLSSLGVSVNDAKDFIIDNLNNPGLIYNTCLQVGVTNEMIVEILSSSYPDLTAQMVSDFFTMSGFNGSALTAQQISYSFQNGVLTNTGNSEIVLTDVGFDMDALINVMGQSMTFNAAGTIEQGFTISMPGYGTQSAPGEDFPDQVIPTNAVFDLNDFLPTEMVEDIPNASGTMNMELTLITTVGTFTDETTLLF